MQRRDHQDDVFEATERGAAALSGFDFQVDPEDFVFYEVARLVDEDRASFEEEEFRRLVDEGIRTHVEDRPPIRAALSGKLRAASTTMPAASRTITMRVVHALEDDVADLTNAGALVLAYTAYIFEHIPTETDEAVERERRCRTVIDQWKAGLITREDAAEELKQQGRASIGPAADLLFASTEDRVAAQTAIEILATIRSPVSARILAHAISEPLLDEDIESAAFHVVKSFWPLPRNYMLYHVRGHNHEDIPILWFQTFVGVDEPLTVDLALEEVRAHGDSLEFREDLTALMHVLGPSRDPELADKVMAAINEPSSDDFVRAALSTLLQQHPPTDPSAEPWAQRLRTHALDQRYRQAAALFDSGKTQEAARMLDEILAEDSQHPYAAMLRTLL